jgi:hypothetical protein
MSSDEQDPLLSGRTIAVMDVVRYELLDERRVAR